MSTDTIDSPAAPPAPAIARRGGPNVRTAGIVLAPALVALAALTVHLFLSNVQLPPPTWIESLPAWKHPYPVVLMALLAGSLVLAAVQAVWQYPRAWVRHTAPLIAGGIALLCVWDLVTLKL